MAQSMSYACHMPPAIGHTGMIGGLLLLEPLPVDLFTTNNNKKLRHLTKMAKEEQDEATSLYYSFVMSMVIAQRDAQRRILHCVVSFLPTAATIQ